MPPESARDQPASQTLSRGIRVLEVLAEATGPLSIDEVAARLGVHRSVAYRLVRTLEDHALVVRDAGGRLALGARLAALASRVSADLQAEALPELTAVANELGMTCFLAVHDRDECVTLTSVEPRHAVASVAQRPGARHAVTVGAPGKAILAQLAPGEWPPGASDALRAQVRTAGERGYATSADEVIPTVQAVAVPLALRGRAAAAIAVVHVASPDDPEPIARRLERCAAAIRSALDG